MLSLNSVAITGIGCISPIGCGQDAFRAGLDQQTCVLENLLQLSDKDQTTLYGGRIKDFQGKDFVTPRKALKVMSREVQLAYAAAHLAWQQAYTDDYLPPPDRLGVVYGSELIPGTLQDLVPAIRACVRNGEMDHSRWGEVAQREVFPLWMLKNLPNMPACHVGIAVDARGPNNSIVQEEVSGLLAMSEALSILTRGRADVMVVGALGSRVTPTRLSFRPHSIYDQHPASESRIHGPAFTTTRQGIAPSEGAAALILETRAHAERRGARVLGWVRSVASRFGTPATLHGGSRQAIAAAASAAMETAGIAADDLAHVCAQGFAHKHLDIEEAAAIAEVADGCPVTAFSSYFGTAGAGGGLLELAASFEGLRQRKVYPTLGAGDVDLDCPVNLQTQMEASAKSSFLKLSFTPEGHAAAAVIECQ